MLLVPLELDVLSDSGCRSAVDGVLARHARLDLVVNNAGMLVTGVAEGFTPEQFLRILDTNAVSWLRVNRAVLPVVRRQGSGTLAYLSSTTAHLPEPFLAIYSASKAAGEALAEVFAFEAGRFGVDTVILVPGAFTRGTEHLGHSSGPADRAVVDQYGWLPSQMDAFARPPGRDRHSSQRRPGRGPVRRRGPGRGPPHTCRRTATTRSGRRPAQGRRGDRRGAPDPAAAVLHQLGIADLLQVAVPTKPNGELS